MKHGTIITIGRQCGSGGHEVGKKLADRLGIAFYDKELLRLAAKESGLAPENFEMYDEVPTNSLLYSLSLGNYGAALGNFDIPIHQKIFLAQFDAIQKLADRGESCVIIGRCASSILAGKKHVLSVFLYGSEEDCVARIAERNHLNERTARERMEKINRMRRHYFDFYSLTRWGRPESYDLMLSSSEYGINGAAAVIAAAAGLRK